MCKYVNKYEILANFFQMLNVIRSSEDAQKQTFLFQQLGGLISIVRQVWKYFLLLNKYKISRSAGEIPHYPKNREPKPTLVKSEKQSPWQNVIYVCIIDNCNYFLHNYDIYFIFPAYKELSRQHFCSNHGILDRRFTPPTYNYSSCGEYFNSIGLWIQNLPAAIDSENSERFDARHQQRSSRYWKIVNGNSKIWQYFGRLPTLIPAANR